jgi:hypothetical protein
VPQPLQAFISSVFMRRAAAMTRLDAHRADGAYVLSHTFMAAPWCRNLASQCERATLAEHRGKPFKHPHPAMTHLPRRFRLRFLRQGELAASPARIECDGHTLEVQRVFLDGKCEHQSMGPNDFEIFADMLDILAVASLHDVKPASGARIDLDAYDLSPRRRKQPFACRPRIEPGIEDALRRGAESARDTGIDSLLKVNGKSSFSFVLQIKWRGSIFADDG